jgi:hypothetical protein
MIATGSAASCRARTGTLSRVGRPFAGAVQRWVQDRPVASDQPKLLRHSLPLGLGVKRLHAADSRRGGMNRPDPSADCCGLRLSCVQRPAGNDAVVHVALEANLNGRRSIIGTDQRTTQDVILPTPDARGEHYGRLFHLNSMAYLVSREFY